MYRPIFEIQDTRQQQMSLALTSFEFFVFWRLNHVRVTKN